MTVERGPFTPSYVLDQPDPDEMVEGYLSVWARDPEPGDNRSDAYWWGWSSARNDREYISDDAHRAVAREFCRRSERGDGA